MPVRSMSFSSKSQDDWVHFRHAWTHLCKISPRWANINIPALQAAARGTHRFEGPAKTYKGKSQAACWKRLATIRAQARTDVATRLLIVCFWESSQMRYLFLYLQAQYLPTTVPSLLYHVVQRECQWALKGGANVEKIDFLPKRTAVFL